MIDQIDKFQVCVLLYRCIVSALTRILDTGETLETHSSMRKFPFTHHFIIFSNHTNSYYVIRDDMLGYYIEDIVQRLTSRQENDGWQVCISPVCCLESLNDISTI